MQQEPGPLGALYDFNLDEELELELDQEAMEAMFTQELASDSDILGMWIPEVLDWPTWVCDSSLGLLLLYYSPLTPARLYTQTHTYTFIQRHTFT